MLKGFRILLSSDFHANVYSWRKEIIDDLIEQGAKVSLAVPYGKKLDYFIKKKCKIFDIQLDRSDLGLVSNLLLFKQYYSCLRKEKPDIVLLYGSKSMLYPGMICRLLGIKYIANVNGFGTIVSMNRLVRYAVLFLYKIVIPKASCVFFQNEYNYKRFSEMGIISKNNILIPGSGVNLKEYCFLDYPVGDKIVFLFCARLIPEKGIYEYLEAAKILKEEGLSVELDIIGFGEPEILQIIKENKKYVNYYGFQSEVRSFIKKAHCIVLPSYYGEGISNSLLESAASGRPIITTNMPGCRETIQDGITGYLIKPKNSQDLVYAMKKFMSLTIDEKCIMGKRAREYVENKFDRKIVQKAYSHEINKALKMEE